MTVGTRIIDYQSYILRLWRDGEVGNADQAWRISLEDPHSAERIGFRTIADLAAWLTHRTGRRTPDGPPWPAAPPSLELPSDRD